MPVWALSASSFPSAFAFTPLRFVVPTRELARRSPPLFWSLWMSAGEAGAGGSAGSGSVLCGGRRDFDSALAAAVVLARDACKQDSV